MTRTKILLLAGAMLGVAVVTPVLNAHAQSRSDAIIEREEKAARQPKFQEMRATPGNAGGTIAVYGIIQGGAEDDRLVAVSTAWANKAEVHMSSVDEQGIARMDKVAGLLIDAGKPTILKPRGLHITVMGLKRDLRNNQMFPITFIFDKAGPVRAMVVVKKLEPAKASPQAAAPDEHSSHGAHSGH
jgi:copper(I)-binding protein